MFIVLFSLSAVATPESTKQQNLKKLFELQMDKNAFTQALAPLFANFNVTDPQKQQETLDKFFVEYEKDYIAVYDKNYTDSEIVDLVNFYNSATGKKMVQKTMETSTELQKSFGKLIQMIQEITMQNQPAVESSYVINFDTIAKGKSEQEVKELFNEEIKHDGLTVVKFSAVWCGPCKVYAPIFEEIAMNNREIIIDGKKTAVKFVMVDIDQSMVIAQQYNVMSVPTTLFFKNGNKVESMTGSKSKDELIQKIKELAK